MTTKTENKRDVILKPFGLFNFAKKGKTESDKK